MENNKLPVYKMIVNECTDNSCDTTGNSFISLVTTPAIETNFIAFGKDSNVKKQEFKIQDTSKRMLIGPLMIADLPIYRKEEDKDGNIIKEYYVVFDAQTIETCVKNFAKKNYNNNINMQHDEKVDNAYLMEVWTVTDPTNDKSAAYGFKGITKGSAMGVVYCPNEMVWNEYIKNGILKGFSVEGMYGQLKDPIEYFSAQEPMLTQEENDMIDELARILSKGI